MGAGEVWEAGAFVQEKGSLRCLLSAAGAAAWKIWELLGKGRMWAWVLTNWPI